MRGTAPTPEELLRDVVARMRERARQAGAGEPEAFSPPPEPGPATGSAAAPPETLQAAPPPHWQEAAEERGLERHGAGSAPLQREARELTRREGACSRLRRLLADGRWHGPDELVAVGGLRFGGRLHELRRSDDGGPPLDVEGEHRGDGAWFYRARLPQSFDSSGVGRDSA